MVNTSKVVTILGIVCIIFIKFVVRPYLNIGHTWQWLEDIGPNFIGTFLLPFGAYWWFRKIFILQSPNQVRSTCMIGLILVVVNEYLQLIPVFGRTFDYLDLLASAPGTLLGYIAFRSLQKTLINISFSDNQHTIKSA
jgi:hypothetical protein